MSQHMASDRRNFQAALGDSKFQDVVNGRRRQRTGWRPASEEQCPARSDSRTARLQIARQNVSSLVRERQRQRSFGFGLRDRQDAGSPINVVERQPNEFSAPKPVPRRQVEDREIAKSAGRHLVNRTEQSINLIPRQGSGELLQSVRSRPVDALMERFTQFTLHVFVSQKRSQRGHDVLQAEAVVRSRGDTKKRVDLIQVQFANRGRLFIKAEKLKEEAESARMAQKCIRGQSPHVAQVRVEQVKLLFALGRWFGLICSDQLILSEKAAQQSGCHGNVNPSNAEMIRRCSQIARGQIA